MSYGSVAWSMMVMSEARTMLEPEPVGPAEIAEHLGVAVATVYVWRHDGLLPPPRWQIFRGPVWDWHDIEAWAKSVGRLSSVDRPAANCSTENFPELLSSDAVATRIGTTAGAVRARARRGQMPAPRWRIASRAVWDSRDIDDWIASGGPESFSSSAAR